jgi:hypothetical protein
MEPYLFGKLAIYVPIADVNVPVRLKTGLHVRQHVLWHPKIHSYAVTIPYLLLPGGETVGATADDEPQLFGPSDHFYSDTAGWVAEFHGAVNVKADEKSQLSSSSRLPSANMASIQAISSNALRIHPYALPHGETDGRFRIEPVTAGAAAALTGLYDIVP